MYFYNSIALAKDIASFAYNKWAFNTTLFSKSVSSNKAMSGRAMRIKERTSVGGRNAEKTIEIQTAVSLCF